MEGILHPGKASLREDRRAHSLHVAVDEGGRVLAHLDLFSPVSRASGLRTCRYSLRWVLIHNAARVAGDLVRFVFGHRVDGAPLLLSLSKAGVELPAHRVQIDERPDLPVAPGAGQPLDALLASAPSSRVPTMPQAPEFRLPFSAIDEAVHVLDSPAEPWTLHWEVRLAGRMHADRLRSAVRDAMGRHPLARARAAAGRRTHHWDVVASPDIDPVMILDCPHDAALASAREALQSFRVPLAGAPPFRLLVARHLGGDVLMLNRVHPPPDLQPLFGRDHPAAGPEIPGDVVRKSRAPSPRPPAPGDPPEAFSFAPSDLAAIWWSECLTRGPTLRCVDLGRTDLDDTFENNGVRTSPPARCEVSGHHGYEPSVSPTSLEVRLCV